MRLIDGHRLWQLRTGDVVGPAVMMIISMVETGYGTQGAKWNMLMLNSSSNRLLQLNSYSVSEFHRHFDVLEWT